jgi:hypothetical protein
MRYADIQIVRPSHEGGCDYGHGRRSVLARNGTQFLLHIAGAKHWGGIGADRYYSPAEIAIYPAGQGACKQLTLAEGRMTGARWAEIAEAIYAHLRTRFPIELISLPHTLLLDEPGDVAEPPPRDPAPKKVHPRIESDRLYRVWVDDDGRSRLLESASVKQGGGKITYRLANGLERDRPIKEVIAEGWAGTPEEAVAAFLRPYEEEVAAADERLRRAASHFAYTDERLDEARNRIKAMREERP